MLDTIRSITVLRIVSWTNRLYFYLQRLPWIGRLLGDGFYANTALKRRLSALTMILGALGFVATKLAYLFIVIWLPVMMLADREPGLAFLPSFLHVFLCLSFGVALFASAAILEPKREKYVCVKLMRMPAARYVRSFLLLRYGLFLVTYAAALSLTVALLGAPVWQGIWLAVLVTSWRLGAEALHLIVFDKTGINLIKNSVWVWIGIGLGSAAAFLPLLAGWQPAADRLMFHPLSALLLLAAGAAAAYLIRYRRYPAAMEAITKIDDPFLNVGQMMKDAQVASVSIKDGDIAADRLRSGQHENKTGYAYLNALFFERHRRFLLRPILQRLWAILVVFLVGVSVILFLPDEKAEVAGFLRRTVLPFSMMILYFLSIGEKVCKAMFYNCDLPLLRYGFYKKPGAVRTHYRIRLLRLAGLNLIPAAALAAAVLILFGLTGAPMAAGEGLLLAGGILALSLFFSAYHLSLYYLLQPYSTELNVRNPLYLLASGLISFLTVISLRFAGTNGFAYFIITVSLVYLAASTAAVSKLAHKTFRVK